ncbi:MAG: FadR family transcriptional regulator [Desulfuromonas sp.]|nr:FadR family transcriptional regulator [Desulfuromonas sp.]
MTTVFKPIRPKKISEEIVGQIKELIAKGELTPGDRIPSERDLAAALGVSRPSVREALMALEMMGFVEARHGGGTFVRSLADNTMADPLAALVKEKSPRVLHALVEVRMGLESWSAYLAAKNATEQEIATLRDLCRAMEEQAADGGWDADIDARFHVTITEASHNALQMHMLNTIYSLFLTSINVALTEFYRKEGYTELLLDQHKAIVDAIAERDPQGSRDAMMAHLQLVEAKMVELLKQGGV